MGTSKIYNLTWAEFSSCLTSTAKSLREEDDLVDVTLSAEGRIFSAHKLVLAASSSLLMKLLKSSRCQHPILMLAGISANDLEAILEFMYQGEVNIEPNQLPSLLQAAQYLDIQALSPTALVNSSSGSSEKLSKQVDEVINNYINSNGSSSGESNQQASGTNKNQANEATTNNDVDAVTNGCSSETNCESKQPPANGEKRTLQTLNNRPRKKHRNNNSQQQLQLQQQQSQQQLQIPVQQTQQQLQLQQLQLQTQQQQLQLQLQQKQTQQQQLQLQQQQQQQNIISNNMVDSTDMELAQNNVFQSSKEDDISFLDFFGPSIINDETSNIKENLFSNSDCDNGSNQYSNGGACIHNSTIARNESSKRLNSLEVKTGISSTGNKDEREMAVGSAAVSESARAQLYQCKNNLENDSDSSNSDNELMSLDKEYAAHFVNNGNGTASRYQNNNISMVVADLNASKTVSNTAISTVGDGGKSTCHRYDAKTVSEEKQRRKEDEDKFVGPGDGLNGSNGLMTGVGCGILKSYLQSMPVRSSTNNNKKERTNCNHQQLMMNELFSDEESQPMLGGRNCLCGVAVKEKLNMAAEKFLNNNSLETQLEYHGLKGFSVESVTEERKLTEKLSDLPINCKFCGITIRQSKNLRRHIEMTHYKPKLAKGKCKKTVVDSSAEKSSNISTSITVTATNRPSTDDVSSPNSSTTRNFYSMSFANDQGNVVTAANATTAAGLVKKTNNLLANGNNLLSASNLSNRLIPFPSLSIIPSQNTLSIGASAAGEISCLSLVPNNHQSFSVIPSNQSLSFVPNNSLSFIANNQPSLSIIPNNNASVSISGPSLSVTGSMRLNDVAEIPTAAVHKADICFPINGQTKLNATGRDTDIFSTCFCSDNCKNAGALC